MGRRYYCDYCDKDFIEDVDARKKHLQSAYHLKLQKQHYDSFRDPKIILAEEIVKTPCHRYMQSGYCPFTGACKYTHYTQEDLWSLKQEIDLNELKAAKHLSDIPSANAWLMKYENKVGSNSKTNSTDNLHAWWIYSEQFESRVDLPPSIKKFHPDDFIDSDFAEWGV